VLTTVAVEPPRVALRLLAERTLRYDFTVWQWGDAIAVDGLLDAAEVLADDRYLDRVRGFYMRWATRGLGWGDHLAPGAALLRLAAAGDDGTLTRAAVALAEWLAAAPRSADGLPLYRPDQGFVRHSCWVDTLYHEPVFLARLAQVTGDEDWIGEAMRIVRSHVRVLLPPGGTFLAHAYDVDADVRRGDGWGRGNAWALLGLVDLVGTLAAGTPERIEVEDLCHRLGSAVLAAQDPSGFWRTLLHDREAYLESSTAAMFGTAFSKGVGLGIFDVRYAAAADMALRAVRSRIDAAGTFYGVSAWTIPVITRDDDPRQYKALPTESNWWGQGAALRALAQGVIDGTATGGPA
jgi:unsaturated rhamnogalacturonyl hydrolase